MRLIHFACHAFTITLLHLLKIIMQIFLIFYLQSVRYHIELSPGFRYQIMQIFEIFNLHSLPYHIELSPGFRSKSNTRKTECFLQENSYNFLMIYFPYIFRFARKIVIQSRRIVEAQPWGCKKNLFVPPPPPNG